MEIRDIIKIEIQRLEEQRHTEMLIYRYNRLERLPYERLKSAIIEAFRQSLLTLFPKTLCEAMWFWDIIENNHILWAKMNDNQ